MSPLSALILDLVLSGLWPISGKIAAGYADPLLFVEAALLLSVWIMAPLVAKNGGWRLLFAPGLRGPLFWLGASSGLAGFLLIKAVALTTPANAAIVCQIEVVYSAFLASWLLGERITARQGAATALVVAGTGLILWRDMGTMHWKGDLILLGAPWLFQASHIFSKRLPAEVDSLTISAARILYGALALAPLAAWTIWRGGYRFAFSAPCLSLLLFHAGVLYCLNNTLWYVAIRSLELAKCTAVILAYPAFTMIYCRLLRIEPLSSAQVSGLTLSMAGALWLTLQMQAAARATSYSEALG